MAAKTLRDAIVFAIANCEPHNSIMLVELLESEIRDYFAHEVMRLDHEFMMRGNGSIRPATQDLFERIFKNIPASKGEK